jgi:hypothetical protein
MEEDYYHIDAAHELHEQNHNLKEPIHLGKKKQPTAADILEEMGKTFRERNKVYGDNFRMVGAMMKILFPEGVPPELLHSDKFHLFELKLVKISRFAISGMTHQDSIHDDAVYSAMIEAILLEEENAK